MKKIIYIVLFLSTISIYFCLLRCSNVTVEKHYNEWIEENDSKYYYNEYGQKQTGWIENGGYWYYMDPTSGKMLKDQWVDNSYYVDGYGRMLINITKTINGITYIFDKDGKSTKKQDYELIIDCTFPKTFRAKKYNWSDVIIENVTYEVKSLNKSKYFVVYYTGMAGNTAEGSNYSINRKVGWKLYDPNGYAVDSGVFTTDAALRQGERFKNNDRSYISTYYLKEKGVYHLELMNAE